MSVDTADVQMPCYNNLNNKKLIIHGIVLGYNFIPSTKSQSFKTELGCFDKN
jgi:hypothetical protein